jgi:hypothetical protein
MHAGRVHGGAGRYHGGGRYAGRVRPSHPIAGRPGRPGYPVAGRPGYRPGYRPGVGYAGRYPYRGYGAAAVGAAALGAAAYGNYNNCYDVYGNYICNQHAY